MKAQTVALKGLALAAVNAAPSPVELELVGPIDGREDNFLEVNPGDAHPSPVELQSNSKGVGAEGSGLGSAVTDALICQLPKSRALARLQKAYRSHCTRHQFAESAVVAKAWWKLIDDLFLKRKEIVIADSTAGVDELWWKAIEYARLNRSTVSFFDGNREKAIAKLKRISLNASKVGQGLSKDAKALKLSFQHWIEAIDRRHRYGHNLRFYCEEWSKSESVQPFFYWLDYGDGRDIDLKKCPRSLLKKQCIKYLGYQEREQYEYVLSKGKIMHKKSRELLDTTKVPEGTKSIFVMSTSKRLYVGQKKKGIFHHSSFLAGGATLIAGMFTATNGLLKSISAESGHYRPTKEDLDKFINFLAENDVDLNEVQILRSSKDDTKQAQEEKEKQFQPSQSEKTASMTEGSTAASQVDESGVKKDEGEGRYKRTLSGGFKSAIVDVPQKAILEVRKAVICIAFLVSIKSKGKVVRSSSKVHSFNMIAG